MKITTDESGEPAVPGRSTRATAANMARAAARQVKADEVTHAEVLESARLLRNAADLLAPPSPAMRTQVHRGRSLADARDDLIREHAGGLPTSDPAHADVVGGGDDS